MANKIEPLGGERGERETNKAIQACNDYLRLGPGRSLAKLLDRYQNATEAPPTKRIKSLADWSRTFGWQARAVAYDAAAERQKTEATEARRREAMETGLALDYERVLELKALAQFLKGQLYEVSEDGKFPNVWVHDVKQIGKGEDAERVDIERFNSAIFEQFRGTIDDLARETGGRKLKTSLETPDLKPLPEALRELAAIVYGSRGQD